MGGGVPSLIMELMLLTLSAGRHGCSRRFTKSMTVITIPCSRSAALCPLGRTFTHIVVFDPHNNQGGRM